MQNYKREKETTKADNETLLLEQIKHLNTLIEKGFIIQFDNGLIVIKHWKINNVIRADRYKETMYLPEKKKLEIDEYGIYKLKMTTNLQPNGNQKIN